MQQASHAPLLAALGINETLIVSLPSETTRSPFVPASNECPRRKLPSRTRSTAALPDASLRPWSPSPRAAAPPPNSNAGQDLRLPRGARRLPCPPNSRPPRACPTRIRESSSSTAGPPLSPRTDTREPQGLRERIPIGTPLPCPPAPPDPAPPRAGPVLLAACAPCPEVCVGERAFAPTRTRGWCETRADGARPAGGYGRTDLAAHVALAAPSEGRFARASRSCSLEMSIWSR